MVKATMFRMGLVAVLITAGWLVYGRVADFVIRKEIDRENEETLRDAISKKDSSVAHVAISTGQASINQTLPETAYLNVPFFCQSPFPTEASWHFHHASCEEAAALQAVYYQKGMDSVDLNEVDKTLRNMVAWQEKHFRVHKDIHADSLKLHLMGFFDYEENEIVILRDATIEDIKKWVADGYPVIAPTYGRLLRNPYYQRPGPEYHMVTVIGYTRDRIITNDVGTKRGKDFSYEVDVFRKSMEREGGDCIVIAKKRDRVP